LLEIRHFILYSMEHGGGVKKIHQQGITHRAEQTGEDIFAPLHGGVWTVWIAQAAGEFVSLSPGLAKMFGYSAKGIDSELSQWKKMVLPEDLKNIRAEVARHKEERTDFFQFEFRVYHRDGSLRWVFVRGRLVEEESAHRLTGVAWEVTEQRETEYRLKEAQRVAELGYWHWDIRRRVLQASDEAFRIFGLTGPSREFTLEDFLQILHPEDQAATRFAIDEALKRGKSFSANYRIVTPAGEIRYIHARANVSLDSEGKPALMIGTAQDVTTRVEEQDHMRMATEMLANSSEGVLMTDRTGKIILVNPAFTRITGYSREEAVGNTPRILKSEHHEPDFYTSMWQSLIEQGHWQGEIWNRRKDGGAYPEWLSVSAIRDDAGEVRRYVAVFHDLTEAKDTQARLKHQAYHDPLTDLPNRLLLEDRLDQAVAHAGRSQSRLGVIFLDLDNFKEINDHLGHHVGDRLLQEVAQRFRRSVRRSDTIARVGGDEFVCVVDTSDGEAAMVRVVDKFVAELSRSFFVLGNELHIGVSIGISMYPDDSENRVTLIRQADSAMYQAKRHGGGTHRFYAETTQERVVRERKISRAMEEGMKGRHLEIVYQPILFFGSEQPVTLEALARWRLDENTTAFPDEFVPIAAESGTIRLLGESVLREAVGLVQQWSDRRNEPVCVHVNLSAEEFFDDDLGERLRSVIDAAGLARGSLCLELPEHALTGRMAEAFPILESVAELGIRFCLDDFGSGSVGISVLQKLPIQEIKISRSVVDNLMHSPADEELASAACAVAHTFGLMAIAKGVETEEQRDRLRRLEFDGMQGYVYSRPLDRESAASFRSH